MAATTGRRQVPYGLTASFTFPGAMPYRDAEDDRQLQQGRHNQQSLNRGALVATAAQSNVLPPLHHTRLSVLPRTVSAILPSSSLQASSKNLSSSSTTPSTTSPHGAYKQSPVQSQSAKPPSSISTPFYCPSAQNTLIEHAASTVTNIPQFQLLVRQHPQHGVAQSAAETSQKSNRFTPLDPPPVCELVVRREVDARFLSSIEASVRACLVSADAPYSEVTTSEARKADEHTGDPLVGTRVESAFIAPCTKQRDECFFIFTDLGARRSGRFRLRFDLIDRVDLQFNHLTSVYSDVFDVVDDKKVFAGLLPSSELLQAIARRGLRLRIVRHPSASVPAARVSITSIGSGEYDGESESRKRRKYAQGDHRMQAITYNSEATSPRTMALQSERYEPEKSLSAGSRARATSDTYGHRRRENYHQSPFASGPTTYGRLSSPAAYAPSPTSGNHSAAYPVRRAMPPMAPLPEFSSLPPAAYMHPTTGKPEGTPSVQQPPRLNLSPRYDNRHQRADPSSTPHIHLWDAPSHPASAPAAHMHSVYLLSPPLSHPAPPQREVPILPPFSSLTAPAAAASGEGYGHPTAVVPNTHASDDYWHQQHQQQQQRLDEFLQRRDAHFGRRHTGGGGGGPRHPKR